LLSKGKATAREIYEVVDVPPTKVYQVLSALEDKALVSFTPGNPRKYATPGIKKVINKLLSRQEKTLSKLRDQKEARVESIKSLEFEQMAEQMRIHPMLSVERYTEPSMVLNRV